MIHALLLAAAVATPGQPALPAIPIGGAFVRSGAVFNAAELARLASATVRAIDHDGSTGEYRGARLADIVHAAGAPVGGAVRGKAARAFVSVSAADGYSAIFTLAELQTKAERCAPILADTRDGRRLGRDVGPLRIVAPCDSTHARWVREVTKLTVIVSPK